MTLSDPSALEENHVGEINVPRGGDGERGERGRGGKGGRKVRREGFDDRKRKENSRNSKM